MAVVAAGVLSLHHAKNHRMMETMLALTAEGPQETFVQSKAQSRFLPFTTFPRQAGAGRVGMTNVGRVAGVGMTSSGALFMQEPITPSAAQEPTPVQVPTPSATQTPPSPQPSANASRNMPTFFVMIDPAHGGEDQGAVFGANLAEKDITLALARRLKTELQERGISARLLRDGDVSLSLEQRAESANEQHAAVYVALHAGVPGQGVRVYAPALPSVVPPVAGKFLVWEGVQANSLPRSQELAQRITVELDKKEVSATQLATPLRPLNNVSAPAVAIELTPDAENLQNLMAQKFQTAVAAGIATGIAQLRSQLEGNR